MSISIRRFWYWCTPLALLLTFSNCEAQKISQPATTQELRSSPSPGQSEEHPNKIDYVFVDGNSLSYKGYDIVKLNKKAKYNYSSETKSAPDMIDVFYAVLKKNGRTLTTFEGLHYPLGNETNFGMYSFLGGEEKQLIVSQAIPRGGRHWVISLSRNAHVIFDSRDYAVGREWISVIDIDKDGVQEIHLPVTAFYGFHNLSSAETPLTGIIFKYDASAQKYFPANSTFKGYALRDVDDDIAKLESKNNEKYLSRRLDILLRYIYAGEEQEAWSFFEREYALTDKEEIKSKIKEALKDEKVTGIFMERETESSIARANIFRPLRRAACFICAFPTAHAVG